MSHRAAQSTTALPAASPMTGPDVTIVMPVQDLDAEVESVVAALGGELERLGRTWEAILVYDGIQGEPWRVGLELQASSEEQVRTIALHKAFGESVCLTSAFEHARGSVILTIRSSLWMSSLAARRSSQNTVASMFAAVPGPWFVTETAANTFSP